MGHTVESTVRHNDDSVKPSDEGSGASCDMTIRTLFSRSEDSLAEGLLVFAFALLADTVEPHRSSVSAHVVLVATRRWAVVANSAIVIDATRHERSLSGVGSGSPSCSGHTSTAMGRGPPR